MKAANIAVSLILGVVTAALAAVFWLGDAEQHKHLLQTMFWAAFGARFLGFAALGLSGALMWWGVNGLLVKTGLVEDIELGDLALLLALGPIIGAFLGTLAFCFV